MEKALNLRILVQVKIGISHEKIWSIRVSKRLVEELIEPKVKHNNIFLLIKFERIV